MNKGLRLLATGGAVWSRRSLQCSQKLAAPISIALQTQLPINQVRLDQHSTKLMVMRSPCTVDVLVACNWLILSLLQVTTGPSGQQQPLYRSFASGSDKKVDSALDQAIKSKDAHKLLEARVLIGDLTYCTRLA